MEFVTTISGNQVWVVDSGWNAEATIEDAIEEAISDGFSVDELRVVRVTDDNLFEIGYKVKEKAE